MMRAIPKSLLPHTVALFRKTSEDIWGAEQLDAGVELTRVRMEPSSRIARDKNNTEIQLAATLFYDCKNSRPSGVKFQLDDIVVFNGQKHQVKMIEPLYEKMRLHHYEIGLVKYA